MNNIFNDDQPLSNQSNQIQLVSTNDEIDILLKCSRNYISPSNQVQEYPCSLVFQASENKEYQRAGVDIIFVIDVSSSMSGNKINLVKKTLEFMLTQLTEIDRISIAKFDRSCSRVLPLLLMNKNGKAAASQAISKLSTYVSSTNIVDGLNLGIKLVAQARMKNNSTAIILLSDGLDNDSETACERARSCIDSYKDLNISYTIHTFGYGSDHDAETMSTIAELQNGGFYYIEKFKSVSAAFANCLGELLSSVANEVEVTLLSQPCDINCEITKVYSPNGKSQFTMPNIMHGDSKEAVFLLKFQPSDIIINEEMEITPIRARVSYNLLNASQTVVVERELFITLKNPDEEVEDDKSVLVSYYRVMAAEIFKEAGLYGDTDALDKARELLEKTVEEFTESEVANTELVQLLISDLNSAKLAFRNKNTYENGGRAEINNKAMSHRDKRGEIYQNTFQREMQVASKNYFRT